MPPDRVSSGSLREIDTQSKDSDIDIVLVPGIGTTPVDSWPFCSQEWLKSILPPDTRRPRLLAFDYECLLNDKFSWETLLLQGYQLLEDLAAKRAKYASTELRPIMFVCHSLGGIIVKQALCIANEQLLRYESLVNAVVALVFLSTPHRATAAENTLTYFMGILKATARKSLKIPSSRAEREAKILLGLSNRFEGIQFRTPILSVYESVETKIRERFFEIKSVMIVGRDNSITHAPLEKVISLSLNHFDTCQFQQDTGSGSAELQTFITEKLGGAIDFISTRLSALEFTYATVSSYSPTSSELAVFDREAAHVSSGKATDGSTQLGYEVVHSPQAGSMEHQRAKTQLPCIMLESNVKNADFRGREDILETIRRELLPPETTVVSQSGGLQQFALCGFGGIGKTEIAQEFALRHKDEFDAIFWVQADEIAKLDQSYQRISIRLGLEEVSESNNCVVSRELVKGWLADPREYAMSEDTLKTRPTVGIHWLIIFDNADDPTILTDYWPQGAGSVLITSRDPLTKNLFSRRTSGMDLAALHDDEGAALLMNLTGFDADSTESTGQQAKRITQLLGGVPLALSQMAGIIRRQELTLSEFLDLYSDVSEHPDMHTMRFGDQSVKAYTHTISTVWAIEKLSPSTRRLLEMMTYLDPDNIQEEILMDCPADVFPEITSMSNKFFREMRTELLQSSLIRRNKERNEVSLHRLVQDAVRAKLSPEASALMFANTVRLIWSNWPAALPKPSKPPVFTQPKSANARYVASRLPACAALYAHVLRLHQLWPSMTDVASSTKLEFAALLSEAALYQSERGRTSGFDGFLETALSVCQDVDHEDRDSVLSNVYFCLGVISGEPIRDYVACREYCEKSFELQEKISQELGVEDNRLALAISERGLSRLLEGRIDEGVEDYLRGKRIQESNGKYIPQSREANLAWGLMQQGRIDEAEKLLCESIEIRLRIFREDDKDSFRRTGRLMYMLGNLRKMQGRHEESLVEFNNALSRFRIVLGERHPQTANAQYKVSQHLIRLGQYEDAITTINNALKTWSIDPKIYRPELARATFLKAQVMKTLGKEQKASVALKVAHRLWQEMRKNEKEKRDMSSLSLEDFDACVPSSCR